MANASHSGSWKFISQTRMIGIVMWRQKDRQPGRGVVGAIMAVRLAADRAAVDHFKIMVQQPASPQRGQRSSAPRSIAVSIEGRSTLAPIMSCAFSVYGRARSTFPLDREFNCS